MGCGSSSSTEVEVYTSIYPVNRADEGVGTQDPQAPSPSAVNAEISPHSPVARVDEELQAPSPSSVNAESSLHSPVVRVDEAGQEPVDEAVPEPASAVAQEPAIEDIRDKYDLGNVIGTGAFTQVCAVTLKDGSGEVRAVKIRENTVSEEVPGWRHKDIFETEIQILQQVNSEHIIRMYEFYEDPHFLYIVMEMCRGGTVLTRLVEQNCFSEKTAGLLGKQMLLAIEHIHSLRIVHRDIRAESFMFSAPCITSPLKLIDFRYSCRFEDGVYMTELFGSPHYLAPELIGQRYTNLIDVWAFGVLMYLLLYGHYPFEDRNTKDLMLKILGEPIPWHTNSRLSQACLNFLGRVLKRFVRKRATASECLQHEWIQALARARIVDTIEISPEIIPSGLRHLTDTRKQMDHKVREQSGRKLREMGANWKKGIRMGLRSGVKDKEGHMNHMQSPEFLRRANKIVSAPSRQQGIRPSEERNDVRSASAVDGKRLAEMYELTTRDADELRRLHREKLEKANKADEGRKAD